MSSAPTFCGIKIGTIRVPCLLALLRVEDFSILSWTLGAKMPLFVGELCCTSPSPVCITGGIAPHKEYFGTVLCGWLRALPSCSSSRHGSEPACDNNRTQESPTCYRHRFLEV